MPRPIVILGPTAGGKSELAVRLAQGLAGPHSTAEPAGEVIGADAFQVYRHLDAGTAKPDQALRERAPHHLIDIVEPTERFTAHNWLSRAHATVADIQDRGRTPIIVGGTNLYLKALIDGMFDGPPEDLAFRYSLNGIKNPELYYRLVQVDPAAADRIKPADRQRIVRALEVYELTGQPISELQTQWNDDTSRPTHNPKFPNPILIGLRWSPEAINPRINLRVKAMFYPDKVDPELAAAVCINGESLIDEVQRLKKEGHFVPVKDQSTGLAAPNQAREALGYKQILSALEGSVYPVISSIELAFERTKVLTRRFAKQQRTWLKRFTQTHWIDCDQADSDTIAEQALAAVSVND